MRSPTLALTSALLLGPAITAAAAQSTTSMPGHEGMSMPAPATAPVTPSTTAGEGISALLTGELGSRSPTGRVTVEGTTVRVAWSGDQPNSTRPWYVHKGTCDRNAGTVGAPSSYQPISTDAQGAGSGVGALPAPLAGPGPYVVAVHAGTPGAPSTLLACGPLVGGGLESAAARRPMPAATPATAGMAGMDHSTMQMPGMQGMNMPGTMRMSGDSSARDGAPTHSMPGMSSAPVHGANMHGMDMHGAGAPASPDSAAALVMAMHARMMADPVIRRRVMQDPAMRRMLEQLGTQASGGPARPRASQRARAKAPSRAPRPAPPPATSMPGMSHGGMQMPGMSHP